MIGAIGSGIVEAPRFLRLALLAGSIGLAALQGSMSEARWSRTLLAAHRGGALLWPENSLLAFKNAIALGVDFLGRALYSARRLGRDGSTVERELETLRSLGVRFVGLQQERVTSGVAEQARGAGLLVGVWTVNDKPAIQRFREIGVDVLITDRPDLAKDLLHR